MLYVDAWDGARAVWRVISVWRKLMENTGTTVEAISVAFIC